MRRKQDKFACVNETKKRGTMVVFTIAVLAVCISGALYARKLQMDARRSEERRVGKECG